MIYPPIKFVNFLLLDSPQLLKTMFELPDMEDVSKVTIYKSSVRGNSEPIVTYGKKQSTSVA